MALRWVWQAHLESPTEEGQFFADKQHQHGRQVREGQSLRHRGEEDWEFKGQLTVLGAHTRKQPANRAPQPSPWQRELQGMYSQTIQF